MRVRLLLAFVVAAALPPAAFAQPATPHDTETALARIAQYVQDYYSRAQSLIGTEKVRVQPMSSSFGLDGFARAFVNELRIEWNPREDGAPALATMNRRLLVANGRKPKPTDTPRCMDPLTETVEPLTMFLPEFRGEYDYTWKGTTREKEGRMMLIDFRERPAGPPVAEWRKVKDEDCFSVSLPGKRVGRVWAHVDTGAVARIEMHLAGPVDVPVPRDKERELGRYFTVDRSDYAIRYRPVTFREPDESLLLPATIDVIQTYRSALVSSRISQVFSDYRRFMTGGRLIE